MPIPCFLIEATDRVRRTLIVRTCSCDDCKAKGGTFYCAKSDDHAHRAVVDLGEFIEPQDADGNTPSSLSLRDETLPWPTRCDACGQEIPAAVWLRGSGGARIWRNPATGEEYEGPHRAPAGALYRAPWLTSYCSSQDAGAPLCVNTPGGGWIIDSQASNCTMLDDRHQDHHHCWVRHGTPPHITVDKQGGPTCGAGGGSIQCGNYHGFLLDGALTD